LYLARVGPRSESLLAWAAGAVGLIGIASAATPELANRSDLVQGLLPPGVPAAARAVALVFGVALVWLSRSLARRRRRAWQLAVVVVLASAGAHLAKGLDFEEATASLLLLGALLRYRRRFDVPGDPASLPQLVVLGLAGALVGSVLRIAALPDDMVDAFWAAGTAVGFYALWLWLRPLSQAVRQTAAERRLARELVERYGRDSLSFFALRHDKSYFFSPSRRAFLAYRVVSGAALVSGDPVGDPDEFDALLAEFRRVAHARGWRLAILGASADCLVHYERLGMRAITLGNEAVLMPSEFSLEGRTVRKLRQSVSRLTKAGYGFRVVNAEDADRAELDAVSAVWRRGRCERGFSMAIDDLYAPGSLFALAESPDGRVGGFLHLVPAGGAWSLSTMRRRPDTPNGLTEFLVAQTLAWAKACGARELSLNFCALADYVAPQGPMTLPRRAARRALLAADAVFQLERLHSFSRKFQPSWRPRYLCVERIGDLPLVGLAYLRVEQLVPAAPWRRRTAVSH
jgi:lysyl-tRNA synthetase, class II